MNLYTLLIVMIAGLLTACESVTIRGELHDDGTPVGRRCPQGYYERNGLCYPIYRDRREGRYGDPHGYYRWNIRHPNER